ncbi:MAG TPA: PilZ domain-containing protein [Polyangiales bacterium]
MDQASAAVSDLAANRRSDRRFAVGASLARVKCKQFEIDGAFASVVPRGLRGLWFRLRVQTCDVINLSKGGIAIESTVELGRGQRVTVHLEVPASLEPLTLQGAVRWSRRTPGSKFWTIGIQFDPFGRHEHHNPSSALDALRGLEARYAD